MYLYLFSFIFLLGVFNASAAATLPEDLSVQGLSIQRASSLELARFEAERDQLESSNLPRFEDMDNKIGLILGNPEDPAFIMSDKESVHQTLFSLIRMRHHFAGITGLVSGFCLLHPTGQKSLEENPLYLTYLQTLAVADTLVRKSFQNENFEEMWRTSVQTNSYTSDMASDVSKDLQELEPLLKVTPEIVSHLMSDSNPFFEDAFHIYSIFAPKLILSDFFEKLLTCGEKFRGWDVKGLNIVANWPSEDGDIRQEALETIGENISLPVPSVMRRGIIEGEKVSVDYEFLPFFFEDEEAPSLKFTFTKDLGGETDFFIKKFSYGEGLLPIKVAALKVLRETDLKQREMLFIEDSEAQRSSYKEMADQGHVASQNRYARMALEGEGGPKDLVEARQHYKLSAVQGRENSQYNYALMLYKGRGGPQDLVGARKYYKLSADQGRKSSQHGYSVMLYKGEGGPKDLDEAIRYSKLAADQGDEDAQNNYGIMLSEKGLIEARHRSRLAADQGKVESQYDYAVMLYEGKGGPKDLVEARRYFKLSADRGHGEATRAYAMMLLNGEGGDQRLREARFYFKIAADKGSAEAQHKYALMLYKGVGGPMNRGDELVHYLTLAARQGHEEAIAALRTARR